MTEMDDRPQVPAVESVVPRQAPVVEERTEVPKVMAGAIVVLLVMVPGAFVAGWRLGRIVGHLRGF